jgi:Uma2 family endonuclease
MGSGTSGFMKTRATYEDLLAVPDHRVAEILDGELYVSPRPASPHTRAASALGIKIGGPYDLEPGPGGWWLLDEPELHFGDDVLVPDLAGWRRERMPAVPSTPFFVLSPDWVCEVVSPSTQQIDRRRKLPIYAREGVGHLWLVDPLARTVEVYRRSAEGWLLVATHAAGEKVRAEPFDAVELDLAALWIETTEAAEPTEK